MNEHREMTPEFVAWLETMQPRTTAEAYAAWHGWKAATSQPRVWLVVDDQGNPEFCAGWPQACHEHINEAIGMDIEEAKTWHVRQAVLMPLPPNCCSAAKNDIATPSNPAPKPHHNAE